MSTQHVGLAALRGLQNAYVVRIAQEGRSVVPSNPSLCKFIWQNIARYLAFPFDDETPNERGGKMADNMV